MPKQELIEPTKGGALVEYVDMGEEYAGEGFENTSAAELVKPFLTQLHYQCPQVKPPQAGGIEGAQPGMLFNVATRQLSNGLDVGVEIVPVFRRWCVTEWLPDRGGFQGEHEPTAEVVQRARREAIAEGRKPWEIYTPNGNTLSEQFNIFMLYNPDGGPITAENAQEAVVAFSGTRREAYREWYTTATNIRAPKRSGGFFQPPLFACIYRMKTKPDSNDKGDWFTYEINLVDPTPSKTRPEASSTMGRDPDLFLRAKALRDMLHEAINAGVQTVDYDQAAAATSRDDDVPF